VIFKAKGFKGCSRVLFKFDDQNVAAASVNSHGLAIVKRALIPSSAQPGRHRVTATCSTLDYRIAVSSFQVIEEMHRTAFVGSIPKPGDVSLRLRDVVISAISGLLLLLLVAFPAELFNSTLEENYEEVRAWLRRPRQAMAAAGGFHQAKIFSAFVISGGVLYSLLSPDFGLNASTLASVLGLSAALAMTTAGFGLPASLYMRRRFKDWGRIAILPGTLVISIVFVAFSRILHMQPGLLYGLIAGFAFRHELNEREEGRLVAGSSLFVLLIAGIAWVLQASLAVATKPDAGFLLLTLDACLAGIFVIGLESLVIGMIPIRFLRGRSVMKWSKSAWALLFGLCASAFTLIFIRPSTTFGSSYRSETPVAYALFAGSLALMAVLFWAYFRLRPESWKPAHLRDTAEGEYEDIERF